MNFVLSEIEGTFFTHFAHFLSGGSMFFVAFPLDMRYDIAVQKYKWG
jgi:hypothetical protein